MEIPRAKAIVASPDMVNVIHNNARVYMERVNEINQTCAIHYLDNPETKETVPLTSLIEQ